MLAVVGLVSRSLYSLCCCLIRLLKFGVHHAFLRALGIASCFSIAVFIAVCKSWKYWEVVVFGVDCRSAFAVACIMSCWIWVLFRVYLFIVSVLVWGCL